MGIKKALNRIYWRFGGNKNPKPFPVNEMDLDAYNEINDYIERMEQRQFDANHLFAKMYIFTSMKIMEQDKTTVFDNNHSKKIANLLKMPIEQIIENLVKSMNDSEVYYVIDKAEIKGGVIPEGMHHVNFEAIAQTMEQNGASLKDIAVKRAQWTNQRAKEHSEMNRLFKENPDAFNRKVWDYDSVHPSIIGEVNSIINTNR